VSRSMRKPICSSRLLRSPPRTCGRRPRRDSRHRQHFDRCRTGDRSRAVTCSTASGRTTSTSRDGASQRVMGSRAALDRGRCVSSRERPSSSHVATMMRDQLERTQNLRLLDPCGHRELVQRVRAADLVLSDSGGIQEEAPALGVPLLVLREKTERPERRPRWHIIRAHRRRSMPASLGRQRHDGDAAAFLSIRRRQGRTAPRGDHRRMGRTTEGCCDSRARSGLQNPGDPYGTRTPCLHRDRTIPVSFIHRRTSVDIDIFELVWYFVQFRLTTSASG
jgi:hypothetical protein